MPPRAAAGLWVAPADDGRLPSWLEPDEPIAPSAAIAASASTETLDERACCKNCLKVFLRR
jgi:hypothetical protein